MTDQINTISKPKRKYHYTKKTGRPTKYKPQYCQTIIDYFSKPKFTTEDVLIQTKKGEKVVKKILCDYFPTIEGFANLLEIETATVVNWTKAYSQFLSAYMRAKQLQKENLIQGGLLEVYNSQFAQFVGYNCTDMRQKQEMKIDGDLQVEIISYAESKTGKDVDK